VDPATLTITATNRSKTYGVTYTPDTTDPSPDFSVSGLLNSDTVASITLVSGGYVNTATVAGSPYTITPSAATGTGLTNYMISYVNGSFTVNTATLTITALNRTKVYGVTYAPDNTPPSVDFTVSGLVNSDTIASITLTSTGYPAGATVAASPYTVMPSAATGTGLGNYTIGYVNGQMTVTQATLTLTASNRSKAFGATYTPDTNLPSVDFSVTSGTLYNGDTVTSITLTCAGYPAAALPQATPYTVTPTNATGPGMGNYIISYVNGQFTIGYGTCTGPNPGGVILPPINTDRSSVYKLGSTVPVKFTVCDANGNPISDPYAVFLNYPSGAQVTLVSAVRGQIQVINEVTDYDIPDSAFRYSSGIWIFNMSTGNLQKNTVYTFNINLASGAVVSFTLSFK